MSGIDVMREALATTHVAQSTANCIDIATDAVWIGKECIVPCVNAPLCRANGCYWRQFHALSADQFVRRDQRDLFQEQKPW